MTSHQRLVGQILLSRGLITEEQLSQAREDQRAMGGQLGRHLILRGAVSRRALFGALAEQWNAPLVDLVRDPPDPRLIATTPWRDTTARGWIPWRYAATTAGAASSPPTVDATEQATDVVFVATSVSPSRAIAAQAQKETGASHIRFVTTTDWDITRSVQAAFRDEMRLGASEGLAAQTPEFSARFGLTRWQNTLPVIAAVAILAAACVWPRVTISVLFGVSNLVFAVNVMFKVLAALSGPISLRSRSRWHRRLTELRIQRGLPVGPAPLADGELPLYTILVPAYHESNIVEKVLANMAQLDYPPSKLEILLLLEEDDTQTIAAAKRVQPPEYVRIVVVPRGTPQTKPRACNYGLYFAHGKYVVIFDAEDRPEPDELRSAIAAFRRADFECERHGGRPVACIQGALNYFNADFNVLTRMFAVEYAQWFDMMLPGMDALRLPIPLGGTSNHFRADALRQVGAWDPYNVTEDADLGLRLDAVGYRTGVIHSTTWEEATSRTPAWIRQRTRWIKGYMMTAAVNLRHPVRWVKHNGVRGTITMVGLVLGTPLAFLSYPLALALTVATYVGFGVSALDIPSWLITCGWVNMVGANLSMIIISGIAATRRYSWRIGIFAVFNPIYWFLHSIAAWRALWQILRDPFTWEKTPHGLSGDYESGAT